MTFMVVTHCRTHVRQAEQGGFGSRELARSIAAGMLQDSSDTRTEIYEETADGWQGAFVETLNRD